MLTDAKLRSQVDSLWDKLWSGGLTNPMDAIEQLSFLLFLKRLDDQENQRERQAQRGGKPFVPSLAEAMRWRHWSHFAAEKMLKHVREELFPAFRALGEEGSSFQRYMANAEFKINKAALLTEAVKTIDQMEISAQNQDVQGDLYEYLLSKLNTAGRNGQFRSPRHIIRLMVQMIDPKPGERIGDLAAGTCGFPVNAWQYILEQHTSPEILAYDAEGQPHNLVGDRLTPEQRDFLQNGAFRAYDNDSGMAMLRIGSMNLMLHGLHNPRFFYRDTLSKGFDEAAEYDVILMNPPFKGAVDKDDVHGDLPRDTTKSELLFLHLILRALEMGGRAAVIVPDGVLFGSSKAHKEIRRKLIQENRLDGVVSMPGGVFKPYAGVSTAILFFTKGAKTGSEVWFYDMAHDGFSLDDKRQPVAENDIPDILACWRKRSDPAFRTARQARLAELEAQAAPLKAERLAQQGEINRLTFESVIAADGEAAIHAELEAAQSRLAELAGRIAPLQSQMEQLSRNFWVKRTEIVAAGYDLTASRYRQVVQDEAFYEQPGVTLERLLELDRVIDKEIQKLMEVA
jgi:type I restriction enzyme M protein